MRPGGNFGGGNFGGMRPGGNFGGGNFGGMRPGGNFGGGGFGSQGFGSREGLGAAGDRRVPGAESMAKRPDRSQLGNFLGMPSDGGMHKLAASDVHVGKTQIGGGNVDRNRVGSTQIGRNNLGRGNLGMDDRGLRRYSNDDLRRRGDYVRRGFDGRGYYNRDWYRRYPGAWVAGAWARDDIWAPMSWDYMDDYFGYGGGVDPMYYDYGNNVTYQDNSVYMNGQDMGTADEYYDQAQDLANTGAEAQPAADVKWMPLGVFAMTHGDQTKANLILQLAVNNDGTIRGNYTATLTNDTKPVQGSVDKKTQRAAWTIGDDKENVIETGIYNLTKDEAPCLVHFGKNKTEQWVLVRLNKDDQQQDDQQQDDQQQDAQRARTGNHKTETKRTANNKTGSNKKSVPRDRCQCVHRDLRSDARSSFAWELPNLGQPTKHLGSPRRRRITRFVFT